jgi:hypothetical protein
MEPLLGSAAGRGLEGENLHFRFLPNVVFMDFCRELARMPCYVVANGGAFMPIRFLLDEDHAFSPDDVKILVDAFEDTLGALDIADREDPLSIRVAKIIIGLAKDGERDPARLRDLALKFVRPT